MKKGATIFLQLVLVILGLAVLVLMFWEPHIEGRNIHSTAYEIYFKDPFLAYAYVSSIAIFVAIFQSFKILGYVRQNKSFSINTVKAFKIIKYCALIFIALVVLPLSYLWIVRPGDDIAGGVFISLLLIFGASVVATAAALLEKLLQNAVDLKSENDLTV